jgi:hypothetical protein
VVKGEVGEVVMETTEATAGRVHHRGEKVEPGAGAVGGAGEGEGVAAGGHGSASLPLHSRAPQIERGRGVRGNRRAHVVEHMSHSTCGRQPGLELKW